MNGEMLGFATIDERVLQLDGLDEQHQDPAENELESTLPPKKNKAAFTRNRENNLSHNKMTCIATGKK